MITGNEYYFSVVFFKRFLIGDWRGIFIFKTKTIDEAKALVEKDPMIMAGRLNYEIHPWWTMKGAKLD